MKDHYRVVRELGVEEDEYSLVGNELVRSDWSRQAAPRG
jgi:hypothetical protein